MGDPTKGRVEQFTSDIIPLFHGPFIKIRLLPSEKEYTVSKPLLCAESPVFSAMFQPGFREEQEQTATLQEERGIVSTQSTQALIHWLYLRTVKFDIQDKTDRISAAIELARLADKYGITGIESDVSDYIQYIIDYQDPEFSVCNDNNTWLISDHIIWGSFLPREHPVRRTLAVACVAGYLGGKNHKFAQEAEDYPNFGADLLREVRLALNTSHCSGGNVSFTDPFTEGEIFLGRS